MSIVLQNRDVIAIEEEQYLVIQILPPWKKKKNWITRFINLDDPGLKIMGVFKYKTQAKEFIRDKMKPGDKFGIIQASTWGETK